MQRKAAATWRGSLESGRGELSSGSGVLSSNQFSADARFGNGKGTNPEELIGAAHAGCFSMALAQLLTEQGAAPARIDTEAAVSLDKSDGGFLISGVRLVTRVEAPGLDPAAFEAAANEAKRNCPVSQALNAPVELEATLVN